MGCEPFSTYDEALDFLSAFTNYENWVPHKRETPKLGLERVFDLMRAIGDPQNRLRAVHIAGTKGKGSTAAMVERVLRRGGCKVGLYTSPHVESEEERIQVNGHRISQPQALELLRRMYPYLASVKDSEEAYRPSFFEIFTAMAFMHFVQEQVDWAVVEVGLGGRLDATNVLLPKVCAITPVSMDHMERLGGTLPLIAGEKAGIIKPGVPVVVSPQPPEALDVIVDRARELDAPVRRVGADVSVIPGKDGEFSVATWRGRYPGLRCSMLGEHQRQNAATAIGILEMLNDQGIADVGEEAVRLGLADAVLMGRIEVLARRPTVVIDVAHNPVSIQALVDTIDSSLPHRRLILVFGVAVDKDADTMLKQLAPRVHQLIVTRINSPRVRQPEELAQIATAAGCDRVTIVPEIEAAFAAALAAAEPDDLVCVTGSFYLAGDARRAWPKLASHRARQAATA